jgi:hypothetical protein
MKANASYAIHARSITTALVAFVQPVPVKHQFKWIPAFFARFQIVLTS